MNGNSEKIRCPFCGVSKTLLTADVRQRPAGETDFQIPCPDYHRQVLCCEGCGVFFNRHAMLIDDFYAENYSSATYGDKLDMQFQRIMDLPQGSSDNADRVDSVLRFLGAYGLNGGVRVLDVGSGLCVFAALMKQRGCVCECVDPDPISAKHAVNNAGVESIYVCSFESFRPEKYVDLVSFNKVLEHVHDPVAMLSHAAACLGANGLVYVELPDGEAAIFDRDGVDREEFFIEHHYVFSAASAVLLLKRAGFRLLEMTRVVEPSGKYTLRMFACKQSLGHDHI